MIELTIRGVFVFMNTIPPVIVIVDEVMYCSKSNRTTVAVVLLAIVFILYLLIKLRFFVRVYKIHVVVVS